MHKSNMLKAIMSGLLGTSCLATISVAQEEVMQLEEIVVTAQKREQRLKDVPISVSAVSGKNIVEAGMGKVEDLQFVVPNFTMTETPIGTNIFIRGIGSGVNQGFEQSVGVYVDGIHYGRAQQSRSAFLDVARVEVLRGPQSILLGKNAVAGALNIITAKPTDTFEGSIFGSYEFIDQSFVGSAVLSGPLNTDGSLRGRVAGRYRKADGYIENVTLDRKEPEREDVSLRATLEWDASDALTLRVKAELHDFDTVGRNIEIYGEEPGANGATYAELLTLITGDPRNLDNVKDGKRTSNGDFSNNRQEAYVLTADYDLGGPTLTAISGYTKFSYDELCDCDFTGAPLFDLPLAESYDQFSQEIRVVSEGGQTIDYIVGGYYQTSDHEFSDLLRIDDTSILPGLVNLLLGNTSGNFLINSGTGRTAIVDSETWSLFGQATYKMTDAFRVTLGGRFSHEKKSGSREQAVFDNAGNPMTDAMQEAVATSLFAGLFAIQMHEVTGERTEDKFSPQVNLQWNASDDAMLYASWVKGSKSGGFDFRANNPGPFASFEESFEFEDEKASNIELGGKLTLLDGAAELNFAAYFTKFSDLQVSIFDGTLGFNVGNAAKVEMKGLEVDGRWMLSNNLLLRGAVAFSDFEFKSFPNGQCYTGRTPDAPAPWTGLCDYTGETNQMVSDWQGNVALDHSMAVGNALELNSTLDVFFTDDYHAAATLDPAQIQQAYAKVNLRVALGDDAGRWQIALLGQNLTDRKILSYGGNSPLAGGIFGVVSHANLVGQGRTVALQARLNF